MFTPKIPPAPVVGFAWEARHLTPRAREPDCRWSHNVARARRHLEAYGTALAFVWNPIGGVGVGDARAEWLGRQLDAAKAAGARSLLLHVASDGGSVHEGLAMIAMLEKFSREVGPTIAFVQGRAASMAAVIVASADYAIAAPGASLLVHGVTGGTDEERAALTERLASILTARTLIPANEVRGWMTTEIALDAYAAESHGLVNEVAGSGRACDLARRCTGLGRHVAFVSDPTAWRSWRRRVLGERAAVPEGGTYLNAW